MAVNDDLGQVSSSGGGERLSDSGYILKTQPTRFVDGLGVECEKRGDNNGFKDLGEDCGRSRCGMRESEICFMSI